jgi:hypothetical protein
MNYHQYSDAYSNFRSTVELCYSGFHNTWACVVNVCVVPYRTLSKNLGILCQLALHSLVFGLFPQLWWRAVFHTSATRHGTGTFALLTIHQRSTRVNWIRCQTIRRWLPVVSSNTK